MKSRSVIAFLPVLLAVLAYALLQSLVATTGSPTGVYAFFGIAAKLAAGAGCFVAAAQFDAGDYMRRVWTFMGITYVVLLSNTLLFGSATHLAGHALSASTALVMSGVLVGVANVSTVVGELLVARTWKAAGMDFQVSKVVKVVAVAGSLLLAIGIAGGAAADSLRQVTGGHLESLSDLCSAVGDIVSLAVLAPILLTALSLRGGSLSWPWGMLALGTFAWVLFDGTSTFSGWMHLSPEHVRPLTEAFRICGCVAYLSAGLLQRSVRLDVASAPATAAVG